MGLTVTFIHLNPKSSIFYYYLDAKACNCSPTDLRNLTDPKVFSKNFKNSFKLYSVISDPNYIVNNAYDYIYKVKNS